MKFMITSILFLFLSLVSAQDYSLNFDGNNDYINITYNEFYPANLCDSSFSLEAWVNLNSISGDQTILALGYNHGDPMLFEVSEGKLRVHTEVGGANAYFTADTILKIDTWYHVAWVGKYGVSGTFYLNGNNVGNTPSWTAMQGTICAIGAGYGGRYFSGYIDEVRIWNKDITVDQIIENMYTVLNPTFEDDLIGYWKFNEGNGTITYDSSGNGYNGTIYESLWSTNTPISITPPMLIQPNDNTIIHTSKPTFSWTAVKNAIYYQIQISENDDFSSTIVNLSELSDTTYTINSDLSFSQQYYWRLRAMNNSDTSNYSIPYSFSIDTTGSYSLSFDGINDYIDITYDEFYPANLCDSSFSLEAWVNLNSISGDQTILALGYNHGDPMLFEVSEGKLRVHTEVGGANAYFTADTILKIDTWYHVAWVGKYGLGGTFYLNGNNVGNTPSWTAMQGTICAIGAGYGGRYFSGYIDEVRIWNKDITVDQIIENMYSPLDPLLEDDLIGYWQFNEGSGTITFDSSGNYHNGIVNGPIWSKNIPPSTPTSIDEKFITNKNINIFNYSLKKNYPNPFNPSTIIEFTLPITEKVIINIFDVNGKKVNTLTNAIFSEGTHRLVYKPNGLSSGVYFYQIITKTFISTKRMFLIK